MAKAPMAPQVVSEDELDGEEEIAVGVRLRRDTVTDEARGPSRAVDLSGQPRVVVLPGRGRVGKSTFIRWAAERAASASRPVILADLDRTNATLASYFDGVQRPEEGDDATTGRWLERLLQHAGQKKLSAFIDLGGGDTSFTRLAAEVPDLADAVESGGAKVVAVYMLGPQTDDLAPLATLEAAGFQPTATALVLNEGLVPAGQTRSGAFARVIRHSAFRAAVERGAMPLWMPRLEPAAEIEARRVSFASARDGIAREGRKQTPIGPFDRSRIRRWLGDMDREMSDIATWLP